MKKSILKIKKCKSKITLFLSDKSKLELDPNVLANYPLYINKEIDNKLIRELKEQSKVEKLFAFATGKIALKEYTTGKMKALLKKNGASDKQIKQIMERLLKFNLINEDNLVNEILDWADNKHYGFNRIVQKMYDLKISSNEINKVKYDKNREYKHAKILLDKLDRKFNNKNDYQKKKSCIDALIRYGFSSDITIELVNKIANSNNNHEINVLKLDYVKFYAKYSKKLKGTELNEKVRSGLIAKGYKLSDIKYVEELNK